jgi:hypothetical protein
MIKMAFDELRYQVENLYSIPVPSNDAAIDQHCRCIAECIKRAGWTEEEYWDAFQDSVLGEDDNDDIMEDEEEEYYEDVFLNTFLN